MITTKRLTLRAAQDSDLAPLFDIYSNADAMRYWDSAPHETQHETQQLVDRLKSPNAPPYLVWDLDGTAIGTGGIHGGGELGFIMHPNHWGKGLAKEALEALIDHVWQSTDWPQINAEADPRNLASVGLMTRLGFQVSGYGSRNFRFKDKWLDSVYLRLDRREQSGS